MTIVNDLISEIERVNNNTIVVYVNDEKVVIISYDVKYYFIFILRV